MDGRRCGPAAHALGTCGQRRGMGRRRSAQQRPALCMTVKGVDRECVSLAWGRSREDREAESREVAGCASMLKVSRARAARWLDLVVLVGVRLLFALLMLYVC